MKTDSTSYSIFLADNSILNLNFGLKPSVEVSEIQPVISSAATRCGFEVPFWINYENTGTVTVSGYLQLDIDPSTTLISVTPVPSTIDGNTIIWDYNDLAPTQIKRIELLLQMPGVMNLGDSVLFNSQAFITDGNEEQGSLTYEHNSIINCSYDPNDKLVIPEGEEEENYTLFDQNFEYTIRFQNTGTDTAFTVRIEDELDPNLEWSTFRPIASSHPYEVSILNDNQTAFIFNNILLPDSTTNEVASHGFITYAIQTKNNLAENTVIDNKADIFFYFNPPIQTNTVFNTLVSELLVNTESVNNLLPSIKVFPNPSSASLTTFLIEDIF